MEKMHAENNQKSYQIYYQNKIYDQTLKTEI